MDGECAFILILWAIVFCSGRLQYKSLAISDQIQMTSFVKQTSNNRNKTAYDLLPYKMREKQKKREKNQGLLLALIFVGTAQKKKWKNFLSFKNFKTRVKTNFYNKIAIGSYIFRSHPFPMLNKTYFYVNFTRNIAFDAAGNGVNRIIITIFFHFYFSSRFEKGWNSNFDLTIVVTLIVRFAVWILNQNIVTDKRFILSYMYNLCSLAEYRHNPLFIIMKIKGSQSLNHNKIDFKRSRICDVIHIL